MKNKKYIIIAAVAVIMIAAVIMITQPFKWAERSFDVGRSCRSNIDAGDSGTAHNFSLSRRLGGRK